MILENTTALIKFNCDCGHESGLHIHTIFDNKRNRVSLRFVPPKPYGKYAVYIKGDFSQSFKVFNDLGTAKNSLRFRAYIYGSVGSRYAAKLLEMVNGDWFVLYDIPVGTTGDELPWVKGVRVYSYTPNFGTASKIRKKAVPMTREEYADWRVKVDREQRGDDQPF